MKKDTFNYILSLGMAIFLFFIFKVVDSISPWDTKGWVILGFCIVMGWVFYTRVTIMDELKAIKNQKGE